MLDRLVDDAVLDLATIEVVIPVHNEEASLEASVARVRRYLETLPWRHRVTIADNASTDATGVIARRLQHEYDDVRALTLSEKGRGRAIRRAWSSSPATVLVYMDVDLSTDLNAVLPLVAPLVSGHSDVAIGTRLGRGARILRGNKRELISRCYNLLLKGTLQAGFSDAQCGFKAIRADVARELLPLVRDDSWFFDTELLVLAERAGLRIHEVPVDWVDDPDSRVDIWRTARDDLRGMARVGWALARGRLPLGGVAGRLGRDTGSADRLVGQVGRFLGIGVASTIAYALLYLLLRTTMPAVPANALALVVTAIANTASNRRFTFGVTGREDVVRHQAQGLVIFAAGLGLTTGLLWLLGGLVAHPARWAEITVLTAANLAVTLGRFVLMRSWIFRGR